MQSDLILPIYTDKEIMMDDISPSNVDFKCILRNFKWMKYLSMKLKTISVLMLKSCLKALRVLV